MDSAIKVNNLSVAYSGIDAINNITFNINRGEFVVLCGRSGSGKSTLLKMLKPETAPQGKTEGGILFLALSVCLFKISVLINPG